MSYARQAATRTFGPRDQPGQATPDSPRQTLLTIAPRHFVYDERVLRTVERARGFSRSVYAVDQEMLEPLGMQRDDILRDVSRRLGEDVQVVLLPPWRPIRYLARLTRHVYALRVARQARELKPDVVHIHESGTLGLIIAFWIRHFLPACRIIFDYHDWIPSEIASSIRNVRGLYGPAMAATMPYLRFLARAVDAAVCISPGQAEWTRETLGISQTVVIQNVRPRREVIDLSTQAFRPQLVFAGAVMRIRRLEFVVDVVATLHARGVQAIFSICGDLTEPDYVAAVQAYLRCRELEDFVHFHGRFKGDDDLARVTGPGAIGITMGLVEPIDTQVNRIASANKLFSYLALGVPVLVERSYENMLEIAEAGGAGASFGTVEECADAAQRIWQTPELWLTMRQNALRVTQELNAETYGRVFETLYTGRQSPASSRD